MIRSWFTSGWDTVGFVAVSTLAMYVSTIVGVRVAGRRTVSQLSAFDFVITIALGTILSSTVLSADASYARGLTALCTLLLLQISIAAARQRSHRVSRLLNFPPEVIVSDGVPDLPRTPWTAQLTRAELDSLLRQRGYFDVRDVGLAVLEPDGKLSVQPRSSEPGGRSLEI